MRIKILKAQYIKTWALEFYSNVFSTFSLRFFVENNASLSDKHGERLHQNRYQKN